jgi:hypothetical protein
MECEHKQADRDWPQKFMPCVECGEKRLVTFVECREYHVHCGSCSFGRWCGQDQDRARILFNRHRHICMLDYAIPDATMRAFRVRFPGRKTKPYIVASRIRGVRRGNQFMTPMMPKPEKDSDEICPF